MTLTPSYLEIDFDTAKTRLQTLMENSNTFQDYNYEGANITMLMELYCYMVDLNTYYTNQLAKNQFSETAELYESVHSLAKFKGYNPKGYISSSGYITVTAYKSGFSGDVFTIDEWTQFKTSDVVDEDGEVIYFTSSDSISITASSDTIEFTVPVKQGLIKKYEDEYRGSDLINNKLYLPFKNFDYDNDIENDYPSIKVIINDVLWTRISDFYDSISGLQTENNVYKFNYTKNGKYVIEFSSLRNVPSTNDKIDIWVLETLGANGNVATGSITDVVDDDIITNNTLSTIEDNDVITNITNASAVSGGQDKETLSNINTNSSIYANTQYRNAIQNDYIYFLEDNSKIGSAYAWGEQQQDPDGGNVSNYNKIFVALIPSGLQSTWSDRMLTTTYTTNGGTTVYIPVSYLQSFKTEVSSYLEPRKMLCAYEDYVVPELIYFNFVIGLKIKRTYKFINVLRDFKTKLTFYFSTANRGFGDTISFKDLIYNMLDTTVVDGSETFNNIKGLENVVIRDINYFDVGSATWKDINSYQDALYPQWSTTTDALWDDNSLRTINLSKIQFPYVSINDSTFQEE